MGSVRCLIVIVIVVACTAAEDPPQATPVSFRLDYAGGCLALRDGEASELTGGVQLWYEDIHLHGDRLTWTQSVVPGLKRSIVERLDLLPGAAGPTPDHVLLDSTACRLPGVGFRGVFTPASVRLERRTLDPQQPQTVRWQMVMANVGYFAGMMETSSGWVPHAGWASEIEAELVADITAKGLENLRFSTIHLLGKADPEAAKRKRTRLDRLLKPLDSPKQLADLPESVAEYGMQSDGISLFFDEQGHLYKIVPTTNTTNYGLPPSDMKFGVSSRVEPGK